MMAPKITVFMPVYNAEKYLKESVESVLEQTFTDFELLIIDDGSSDNSVNIIESFNDKRIRLIHNGENKGLPYTRNRGLELARGKYLAIMDSDDVADTERLAIQYRIMENNQKLVVLASGNEVLSSDKTSQYGWKEKLYSYIFYRKSSQIKIDLIFHNVLVNSTTMIRLDFLKDKNICYNEKCFVMQDYEIWTQICAKGGNIQILRLPLVKYREHGENISNRTRKNSNELRKDMQFYIQKKYLKELGWTDNDKLFEKLKKFGREFEEKMVSEIENPLLELFEFYEMLLRSATKQQDVTYADLKKYLRLKYLLEALKYKHNRVSNVLKVFTLS